MEHKLKTWRRAKGLSTIQLGTRLGIDDATVSRYERRRRIPAPEVMVRIFVLTAGEVEPNHFYDLPPLDKPNGALAAGDLIARGVEPC